MIKPITKKKKIEILAKDNQDLMKENQRLRERENSEMIDKVIRYMSQYDDLNKKIRKKYKELNQLKRTGLRTSFIYRWKFFVWNTRRKMNW